MDLAAAFRPVFENSPALRVYLYGSRARGDAAPESDADLIVVADTGRPFVERFRDFTGILRDSPVAVEMMVYTQEEFERMLAAKNGFLTKAVGEGVLLYERRPS
jgi:predicted nucleotidyltransferase